MTFFALLRLALDGVRYGLLRCGVAGQWLRLAFRRGDVLPSFGRMHSRRAVVPGLGYLAYGLLLGLVAGKTSDGLAGFDVLLRPDCEHCQDQTPVVRKVYDAWKSRGVEVFSIASQADEAKWRAFGPKYGVNWTDVRDPDYQSRYPEKYYIDNTPEIYVLDKDKIIVAKNLKADQLPDILTATLGAAAK